MAYLKVDAGGEKFLPFAKSRISALRMAGLSFSAQHFLIDGFTVQVRIQGKFDYIRIEGGNALMPMDSGVVDLGALAGDADAWGQLSGILHPAGSAIAYGAAYVQATTDAAVRTVDTDGAATGQFAGKVSYSTEFRGELPLPATDGTWTADAFKASTINIPDANLSQKKVTALACPPSLFTGKCRMYVQALYGLHLHRNQVKTEDEIFYSAVVSVGQIPKLSIKTRGAKGWNGKSDAQYEQHDVVIDTNAGVWLDLKTGNHWLFAPNGHIYRLVSDAAVEPLRRYLITKNAVALGMDDDERQRLEAHILCTARPCGTGLSADGAIANTHPTVYGMGYGWHWAWTEAKAVCISVSKRDVVGSEPEQRLVSVKRTLAMTLSTGVDGFGGPTASWVCTYVADPEIPWVLRRQENGLFAPDWEVGELGKIAPRFMSESAFANAPFYAYYAHDTLMMCTASMQFENESAVRSITPSYFFDGVSDPTDAGNYGSGTYVTSGSENGSCSDVFTDGHWTVSFRIGDITTPLLYRPHLQSVRQDRLTKTTTGAYWPMYEAGGFVDDGAAFQQNAPGGGTETILTTGRGMVFRRNARLYNFLIEKDEKAIQKTSGSHIVIPFYDAQAVYFECNYSSETSRTLTSGSSVTRSPDAPYSGLSWEYADTWTPESNPIEQFFWFDDVRTTFMSEVATSPDYSVVTSSINDASTSNGAFFGSMQTGVESFLGLGSYDLDTADSVPLTFSTYSSVCGPEDGSPSVVLAPSIIDPVGFDQADEGSGNYAIVGWV